MYDVRFLTAAAGYPGLPNVLLGLLQSYLPAMFYRVRVSLSLRGEGSGTKDERGWRVGRERVSEWKG